MDYKTNEARRLQQEVDEQRAEEELQRSTSDKFKNSSSRHDESVKQKLEVLLGIYGVRLFKYIDPI